MSKECKINRIIANIRHFLYSVYLTITYKVYYQKNLNSHGWFIKKKPVTMILAAPVLLPVFMLYYGILFYYISFLSGGNYRWIESKKRKLSFNEKLKIKRRLVG